MTPQKYKGLWETNMSKHTPSNWKSRNG
jgi:hypothetical protein